MLRTRIFIFRDFIIFAHYPQLLLIHKSNMSELKINISNKNRLINVLLISALMLTAFIVRFIYVGKTDIGNDECFSLYYSQFSSLEIFKLLITGDGFAADNPPLWELVLSVWIKIFGIGLLSLRSLSLLFNVLTIIPLYKLANDFFSRRIAVGTSLLYIFSSG